MGAHVVLVEDEPAIADFVGENLRHDDHRVAVAGTLAEAVNLLRRLRPSIVLVDVGLPDGSGFDLVRRIRLGDAGDEDAGVIVLTARAEEQDRVRGFQRGADDYVTKPFHYPELLARVNALQARLHGRRREVLVDGEIRVDLHARAAVVAGEPLHLPAKEFDLLAALARDPERVLLKQDLLERVWGYDQAGTTRTLDSHASRLRRRLEERLPGERLVINHWGVGYALRGIT